MGADLYLASVEIEEIDFDNELHYFRDSYNHSSVMWRMSLSWSRDVTPLLDEEGLLRGENLKKLIDLVENAELTADYTELAEWVAKKGRLLRFLKNAYQTNDAISCSL